MVGDDHPHQSRSTVHQSFSVATIIQWLMFQMGGVGPMMGQANVFFRYFPEKIPPAIERYQNECRRLFEVLDTRLSNSEWLADEYSIADIANWCWVRTYEWSGPGLVCKLAESGSF